MDHTSSDSELDPLLLDQYFVGESTPAEVQQIEQWIRDKPERRAFVEAMRLAWTETGRVTNIPSYDVDAEWTRFVQQSTEGIELARGARMKRPRSVPLRIHPAESTTRWARVSRRAGLLIGAIAAAVLFVWVGRQLPSSKPRAALQSYATGVGQRATITLVDGSRVTLAPRTVLRVDPAFGGATRTVSVVGEAFFDVAHTNAAPFIVRSGLVATRVLGTTFDVRRYATERVARIAVATGKVAVGIEERRGTGHAPVTISAGSVAFASDSSVTSAVVSDVAPYMGWVTGRLVFKRAPVSDVLATVGQWYGYEFRLSDSSLATRHLSATFDQQSSADVLQALCTVLDVTMTFDGSVVTLHARQHSAMPRDARRGLPHDSKAFSTTNEVGR